MKDLKLQEKIDQIPPTPVMKERQVEGKVGKCARCGDFGRLFKAVWNDPYTDSDGIGFLCGECIEKTHKLQVKYNYYAGINIGRRGYISDGTHPVPKPIKKKKGKT